MLNNKETYVAAFLDITNYHQMADLPNQPIDIPVGVAIMKDGCIQCSTIHELDGYEPIEPGTWMPTIAECRDRIHALHDGPVRLEYFCMSPDCEHFQSVVKATTCEDCPNRRGRD